MVMPLALVIFYMKGYHYRKKGYHHGDDIVLGEESPSV